MDMTVNYDYDVNTDDFEYLQELVNQDQKYLGDTLETVDDYDYEYDKYSYLYEEQEQEEETEELVTY